MKKNPTVRSLAELATLEKSVSPKTPVFVIVGEPITPNFYPHFFLAGLAATIPDAIVVSVQISPIEFPSFMRLFIHPKTRECAWDFRALLICSPFKRRALEFADNIHHRDSIIGYIGAINCLKASGDQLHGLNTEAETFLEPFEVLRIHPDDTSFCIIGTGATADGIAWSLRNDTDVECKHIRVIDRNRAMARSFCKRHHLDQYGSIASFRGDTDILINATAQGRPGTRFENDSPVRKEIFSRVQMVAIDMNIGSTPFLREARYGLTPGWIRDGGAFFFSAGIAQFKFLVGKEAPEDEMRESVADKLFRH